MSKENREFSVYSITFNGEVVYVGMTSLGYHRWVCHKTKARGEQYTQHSRPIHNFMRENTVDPKTFPEFKFNIIAKCWDEDVAKELEIFYQAKYDLDYHVKEVRPKTCEGRMEIR